MKPVTSSPAAVDAVAAKIKEIWVLIQADDGGRAEQAALALLKSHPQRHDVQNIMGVVQVHLKKRGQAVAYFEAAVKAEPNSYVYLNNLGRLYLELDFLELALPPLTRALEINPRLVETLWAIGDYYRECGKAEKGLPYLDRALAIDPQNMLVRGSRAESLEALGRLDEAKAAFLSLLKYPQFKSTALCRLSQLGNPTIESPLFAEAKALLQSPEINDRARSRLHNALANFYEGSGDVARAFEHFERANVLQQQTNFDIDEFRASVDSTIATFTPEFFAKRRDLGHSSELPVFVVGMPRSGTTLTEQIIANHPAAGGAGELLRLTRFSDRYGYKTPERFGETIDALGRRQTLEVAENFINLLKFHAPGATRVVDKLPHNFLKLGFIALLFPNARIIHCRRNPADTCWSCFHNQLDHAYNKDLRTLGLYYREYVRLMDHWRKVLRASIYESRYEELTSNPEESVRRMLDFIGLPWDQACLDFHKGTATISTISRQQVRRPIYKSSVERWRRYESHLAPLIEALGDCMEESPTIADRA